VFTPSSRDSEKATKVMLIEQQYAMMDSIGVEGRILRWGDAWEISEADTTRWTGISFASVKFSSIYPDSTVRRTLALTTEFAPYVCPEQGRTGGGRGDEPQAALKPVVISDRWPAGWILSHVNSRRSWRPGCMGVSEDHHKGAGPPS
jgi:hypothetical protein